MPSLRTNQDLEIPENTFIAQPTWTIHSIANPTNVLPSDFAMSTCTALSDQEEEFVNLGI